MRRKSHRWIDREILHLYHLKIKLPLPLNSCLKISMPRWNITTQMIHQNIYVSFELLANSRHTSWLGRTRVLNQSTRRVLLRRFVRESIEKITNHELECDKSAHKGVRTRWARPVASIFRDFVAQCFAIHDGDTILFLRVHQTVGRLSTGGSICVS